MEPDFVERGFTAPDLAGPDFAENGFAEAADLKGASDTSCLRRCDRQMVRCFPPDRQTETRRIDG